MQEQSKAERVGQGALGFFATTRCVLAPEGSAKITMGGVVVNHFHKGVWL